MWVVNTGWPGKGGNHSINLYGISLIQSWPQGEMLRFPKHSSSIIHVTFKTTWIIPYYITYIPTNNKGLYKTFLNFTKYCKLFFFVKISFFELTMNFYLWKFSKFTLDINFTCSWIRIFWKSSLRFDALFWPDIIFESLYLTNQNKTPNVIIIHPIVKI